MATKRLRIEATAGINVYFSVWRSSDNLVFDFSDNTFKAIGSATTPYLTATENTNEGGAGRSHFYADLDLALLGATEAIVQPYQRAGGSPAPLTDITINDPLSLTLSFGTVNAVLGGRITPTLRRELDRFDANFTLTADGQPVDLTGWAAVLTVRGIKSVVGDSSANWFPDITGTITAEGRAEFLLSTPGFTGDRGYTGRVTLTKSGATTIVVEDSFNVLA